MEQKAYTRRDFLQAFSLPLFIPGVNVHAGTPDIVKLAALLKKPDPLTWVFTGDSVTQGAHHTYGDRCYPEIIAERIRWELRRITDIVINSGVNGTNTKYLLDSFEWYVTRFRPSVVSVMYGINDCQEKAITVPLFRQYLSEIIQRVRQQSAIPVIHTPNGIDMKGMTTMKTASRARLPEYVNIIAEVAKQEQCIVVDHWKYWEDESAALTRNWLDDPLHPNAEGHLQMARLFFKATDTFDDHSFTCTGEK